MKTKENNKNKQEYKQESFCCENVLPIDIEPEDRSVGIFGNIFTLGFEAEQDVDLKEIMLKQILDTKTQKVRIFIDLNDEQFEELLKQIEPFLQDRKRLEV